MEQITPAQLKAWFDDAGRERPVLLDVREPWEVQICRIPDALHMPMREVPARVGELDPDTPLVAICHHGARSMQVGMFLEKNGCKKVHNLAGGVDAWSRTVDPSMPVY
jgi:rhodanese-related sulfurtransferase